MNNHDKNILSGFSHWLSILKKCFVNDRYNTNLEIISSEGGEMNKGLIFTILILLSGNLMADSFRCGNALVKSGDSSNTLIKKCGNPQRKYNSYESISDHGRRYNVGVSNWVYERTGKKDMIVSLRNGEVIKIQPD